MEGACHRPVLLALWQHHAARRNALIGKNAAILPTEARMFRQLEAAMSVSTPLLGRQGPTIGKVSERWDNGRAPNKSKGHRR